MNFVDLQKEILTVVDNGTTYSRDIYKSAITVTGVTDEDYSNYDTATEYIYGDFCIVPELKSIYKSAFGTADVPNKGNLPPAFTDKWVWYGYINSCNMFALDEHIGAKTVGSDIVITLDFSMINTLCLVDIDFVDLNIKQIYHKEDGTDETVKDEDLKGTIFSGRNFADICYNPRKKIKKVILDELVWLPNSTVTLTFIGDVSIGTLGRGRFENLFATLKGTKLDWQSNSKFLVDEFTGYRTVLRYGKVRMLDVSVQFNTSDFNATALRIDEILDRNMLWLPTKLDIFTEAITIGYLENFSMPLESIKAQTTATIIGVAK